ncbi:hypothetical protein TELCIR_06544 [Teladorsagia circumcincta]|uniref:RRM domain-containing protein n=1 Tax=Teladorsagia circumcincta TaxID=45464 RepID=A0A2G9UMV2_TELCI|nr:hypothetical protein TELCIR_06544 [Teladorsagia circumcincta]
MELDNQTTVENGSNGNSGKSEVEAAVGLDQDRIHISPVPKYFGFKQFKKLLEKHLSGITIGKIRQMKFDAYVSFKSAEDAQAAISKLDGLEVKKTVLRAQLAQSEQKTVLPKDAQTYKVRTARESVTKLADVPYTEQLLQKTRTSLKLCERLIAEMRKANVGAVNQLLPVKLLKEVCVGFVGGRFSNNEHYVIPIGDVDNITLMTKRIVEAVTNFVQASGLPPFDEFSRVGVWKMLTVRQFGADVMLILTVNPFEDRNQEEKLKQEFCASICRRNKGQVSTEMDSDRHSRLKWSIHKSYPLHISRAI